VGQVEPVSPVRRLRPRCASHRCEPPTHSSSAPPWPPPRPTADVAIVTWTRVWLRQRSGRLPNRPWVVPVRIDAPARWIGDGVLHCATCGLSHDHERRDAPAHVECVSSVRTFPSTCGVWTGETLDVTEHGRLVARLAPAPAPETSNLTPDRRGPRYAASRSIDALPEPRELEPAPESRKRSPDARDDAREPGLCRLVALVKLLVREPRATRFGVSQFAGPLTSSILATVEVRAPSPGRLPLSAAVPPFETLSCGLRRSIAARAAALSPQACARSSIHLARPRAGGRAGRLR